MGKVLVLYYSHDGNTAEMAKFIADGVVEVPNVEVQIKSID
jgi:flavodoxin